MQLPSGFTAPLNSRQPPHVEALPGGMNNLQCMHERSGKAACASYPKLSRAIRSDSDSPDRSSQSVVVSDFFSDISLTSPPHPDRDMIIDDAILTGRDNRNINALLFMWFVILDLYFLEATRLSDFPFSSACIQV